MFRKVNFPQILSKKHYAKSALRPAAVDEKYRIDARPDDPTKITCDYIGPPDKQSNLRPIVRHIAQNETQTMTKLRELRDEVELWNHNFWTKHNKRFYEERQEYVEKFRKTADQAMTADEMSVFYKDFLDRNWRLHFYFNLSWYIKNWTLLFLSLRVEMESLLMKRKKD